MDNETEYVRRLQEVDDRSRRNEGRIKKLEADQKALLELTSSVRELANEQGHVFQSSRSLRTATIYTLQDSIVHGFQSSRSLRTATRS